MNCPHCQYLLWELPEPRCPECGRAYETTDFAFPPGAVHFLCRDCGQPYLGDDDVGLPRPRTFACVRCGGAVEAARMPVRCVTDGVHGNPLRVGTPWEHRCRVGYIQSFVDGVARLCTQPGDYFRRCLGQDTFGAAVFSVACAYFGTAVFLGLVFLLHRCGLLGPLGFAAALLRPAALVVLAALIPVLTVGWTYVYSCLIQAVLWCLGQRRVELQRTVHAVALGSAVLPALLSLPLVGLPWYVAVVSTGVENLHQAPRPRALLAAALPVLAALNLALAAFLAAW